ncbi:DUF2240 family protein [Thermococcus sp. Bubb.Bath]|uniref:DUF2240 family protein n=1 Tax=Thermococcus sp. Bubb.Bath TaxID=1638242 RepID=UPI00143B39A3|nr:DUF2240 family protein [Thermococcus sp. Bubb.Bath]
MHPLERAVKVKGSTEFTRSELVGLLSFTLRLMSPGEAKKAIEEWLSQGILTEEGDTLKVNEEAFSGVRREGSLFDEMLEYVSSSLGWEDGEVLSALDEFSGRYGSLDRKLVLYLFAMEKGIDMSRFKDRLDAGENDY